MKNLVHRILIASILLHGIMMPSLPEARAANTSCVKNTDYTETLSGNFTILKFTNTSRVCDWTFPLDVTEAEIAIVGGGGAGGGNQQPGGGGGGQLLYNRNASVSGTYAVTIGAGGTKVTGNNIGGNGGDTSFGSFASIGGGGGGSSNSFQTAMWNGRTGGSSGGSNRNGRSPKSITANMYNGWTSYGNSGGSGAGIGASFGGDGTDGGTTSNSATGGGGGGGGAGSVGAAASASISGFSATVNGGTGGSALFLMDTCLAAGGSGGANKSSYYTSGTATNGGTPTCSGAASPPNPFGGAYAVAGTANTGSGGGGTEAGGSGVVIVKFGIRLNVTINTNGGTSLSNTSTQVGGLLASPSTPTRIGYELTGWSLTDGGSVVTFPFDHGKTSDFTLFAIWTRDASCQPTTTTPGGSTVVTINAGIQTTSCSTTWEVPIGVTTVEMLVVGGGGSGAYYYGGGGGGGGVTTGVYSVTAGSNLNVTIGGGGARKSGDNFTKIDGSNGGDSSVTIGATTYKSEGGKGGIGCSYTGIAQSFTCNTTNVGGTAGNSSAGAGGIGVYSTDLNARPSEGARGLTSTITGSSITYGSGGNGGDYTSNGADGTSNFGNGGEGSGASGGSTRTSGAGAAGVVIFRYNDTAPSTTGSFTLTSSRRVGQSISINTNSISTSGRVVRTTYQWQRGKSGSYLDIPGATSDTYTIQDSDLESTLKLIVTNLNSGGNSSVSATSSSILNAAPTISAASITGTLTFGNVLTATATTVGSATTLSYQWSRSDTQSGTYSAISGATARTYTTVSADAAKWIRVTITVTNDGGAESLNSTASQIAGIQLSTPSAPTVSATSGSITSITVSFTADVNANSYTVRVFQAGALVGSARTSFSSGSTITGLSSGTEYTVTLTAIGDGTMYTDSAASAATAVTTNAFLGSALIPQDNGVEPTLDGFQLVLKNYDSNFTYSLSLTNNAQASISSNGVITVTNLAPGASSILTITTSRENYPSGSLSITGTAISLKTVSFNSNGGAGTMSAQTGRTSANLNINSFTRQYYNFLRWNTESNGTGTDYENSALFGFVSDLTLYALWSPISLSVTFNSQGGTPVSDVTTTYLGKITSAPTPPTRIGYTFLGWSATSSGSVITFEYSHNQNSNFTLYAIWQADVVRPVLSSQPTSATKQIDQSVSFSVVATVSDGGEISYQWKKNGTDIANATSSTYSIAKLTLNSAGEYTVVVTNTKNGTTASVISDKARLTVTAITYAVTYTAPDKFSGSVPVDSAGPYAVNATVTILGNSGALARAGYVFAGWTTAADATVRTPGSTFSITSDVTFIAAWTIISGTSSSKAISALSVKSTGLNRTSELLSGFSNSTTTYSIYVPASVSAVVASITREAGSLMRLEVKVNNSGTRKLSFTNNSANSGALPLPSATNTLVITAISTDLTRQEFTITVYRDTKTIPTGGSSASPAPVATPIPANQVVSLVRFLVNTANGLSEVPVSPTFSTTTFSYTASFSSTQSATQLKADFTGSGVTLRLKVNNGAFLPIASTGSSSTVALNKGSNSAILRVFSADGSSVDYNFTLNRANS